MLRHDTPTLLGCLAGVAALQYALVTTHFVQEEEKVSAPPIQKVSVRLAQAVVPTPPLHVPKPAIKKTLASVSKPVEKQLFCKPKETKVKTPREDVQRAEESSVPEPAVEETPPEQQEVAEAAPPQPQQRQVAQEERVRSDEVPTAEYDEYMTALRRAIDRNKRYPAVSKRLDEEGMVVVGFRISRNGVFSEIRLVKSSGIRRLDSAAVHAVTATERFRPFGDAVEGEFLDMTVPIRFQIHSKG